MMHEARSIGEQKEERRSLEYRRSPRIHANEEAEVYMPRTERCRGVGVVAGKEQSGIGGLSGMIVCTARLHEHAPRLGGRYHRGYLELLHINAVIYVADCDN